MDDFWVLFWAQFPEQPSMRLAYAATERLVKAEFGRTKFRNYESFKVAKHKYYKRRRKPKTQEACSGSLND